MTRLASSARDFAIACLARGDWMSAEDALSLAGEHDAASALRQHRTYRSFDFGPDTVEPRIVWRGDRRVGARVALYLRCMRRAEALDRWEGDGWAAGEGRDEWSRYRMVNVEDGRMRRYYPDFLRHTVRHARPLWTLAPAHQPEATPSMRRGSSIFEP